MVSRILVAALCCAAAAAGEAVSGGRMAYRLFPGDLILIEVFGHDDLRVEARVPGGGEITFPLIGNLAGVAGRSPEALAAEITARLADGYIRNPSVTVQVRDYGPRLAWVVGAVRNPGQIKLDPLRPNTAQQVVGAAGGFDEDADRSGTVILRETAGAANQQMTIPVPSADPPSSDVILEHGDVVMVPRADRIYVLGQVQYPRAIPLPSGEALTVSKAISLAGGFGRFARDNRVQLVRRGQQPQVVDVRAVLAGSREAADPALRAGDTIFVPESRF